MRGGVGGWGDGVGRRMGGGGWRTCEGGGVGGWGRMGSGRGRGVGNSAKMSHFQEVLLPLARHTSTVVHSAVQVVPRKPPRPMNCLR